MPTTNNACTIGIDIGGTKIAGGLFSHDGLLLEESNQLLEGSYGDQACDMVVESVNQLLASATSNNLKIVGVGISVPGIVYQKDGSVWVPNIEGWIDYPLKERIQSELKKEDLSILLESDRSCYILGETWMGNAIGAKNAIFISVGTGIGAGILIDGRILHGANDIAGSVGWLALNKPFLNRYEGCGCFEYHASGRGLEKVALAKMDSGAHLLSEMAALPEESISAKTIFKAYRAKDPLAVEVIKEAIEYWGMAVANFVSIFNPEKIIFGGGVFGPGLDVLDDITEEAKRWAQPISMSKVEILGSKLQGKTGMYGAGKIGFNSMFNR